MYGVVFQDVEASFKDKPKELAELLFPFATCFEPSLMFFVMMSVQVNNSLNTKKDSVVGFLPF